ncbi:MAG: type II toxin-antitoxin system RelB/DinJ family antitoxin [Clostridiales bacterium]|nr:type II toxin-antitoxin system RelB/DinJ family antitoxin [Clostridiales bacterium]
METMGLVQARTPERIKSEATEILGKLGLNMSTYINMSLNQLIIQGRVPFTVSVYTQPYTDDEIIAEVQASLRMEGMDLTDQDLKLLRSVKSGDMTGDEARQKILEGVQSGR